jgi:hypothetical protein
VEPVETAFGTLWDCLQKYTYDSAQRLIHNVLYSLEGRLSFIEQVQWHAINGLREATTLAARR